MKSHECGTFSLTNEQKRQLWDAAMQQKANREATMPTEQDAIFWLNQAYTRLTELGWNSPDYCPKDGSQFDVIEAGSTGIHKCAYWGEWPEGSYMIFSDGDIWPSRPVLYRVTEAEIAKREELKAAFSASRES